MRNTTFIWNDLKRTFLCIKACVVYVDNSSVATDLSLEIPTTHKWTVTFRIFRITFKF